MGASRRHWLRVSLGGGAFWLARAAIGQAAEHRRELVWGERALNGFGTTLRLRAAHRDAHRLELALDHAVSELRRIESVMSLFDPDSQVSRLNRQGHLSRPDPLLLDVLAIAQRVAEQSDGGFDITVQPLWALWQRRAAEQGRPSDAEIDAQRRLVGWRGLRMNRHNVAFARPGMAITLNGIAQGFAADRARAALQAQGVEHALLDTGEWASLGQAQDGAAWTLGVEDPRDEQRLLARLSADGRAIATSSDAHYSFSADRAEHHILDPRTGHSPPAFRSVTVLAAYGALADALTKVMFMDEPATLQAAAKRWSVDVLALDRTGTLHVSAGIARLLQS